MLSKEVFLKAYELLDAYTPLVDDCGLLCGSRCCSEWKDEVGIYLLPGEDQIFDFNCSCFTCEKQSTAEYEFCPSWQGEFYFVKCTGNCPRDKRPIQCRTFPLEPHLRLDGMLEMIISHEYEFLCPLVKQGIALINSDFVKNAKLAWTMLLGDSMIYEDVQWESEKRRIKYPDFY